MGFFDKLFGKKKSQFKEHRVEVYEPAGQYVPIIIDSLDIIKKTNNVDTYFSRYKLASNHACNIMYIVKDKIYNGMTPADIYTLLNDKEDYMHKQFIDRLFDTGKENNLIYQMYEANFRKRNIEYIVRKMGDKKFHFCKVAFNDNGKLYTYVTKDKSVKVGDTVTIPTGNSFVPDSKVLQVREVFDSTLADLPFDISNLRCVERKLKSVICPHCGAPIEMSPSTNTGICTKCHKEFYFMQQ